MPKTSLLFISIAFLIVTITLITKGKEDREAFLDKKTSVNEIKTPKEPLEEPKTSVNTNPQDVEQNEPSLSLQDFDPNLDSREPKYFSEKELETEIAYLERSFRDHDLITQLNEATGNEHEALRHKWQSRLDRIQDLRAEKLNRAIDTLMQDVENLASQQ